MTTPSRFLACLAGAAILSAISGPAAARPAPAKPTARTASIPVTRTAADSFILGNPKAPNTLIEYMSYTCGHCAHFAAEAQPGLRAALASGKLKFEIRNLLRDPVDLTAAMLARCGTTSQFAANHAALMASQARWLEAAEKTAPAAQQAWFLGEFPNRFDHIAADTGLYGEMQKRGFTRAQLKTCLANPATPQALVAQTKDATETKGIDGTPAFYLNGKKLDSVYNWATLKPFIDAL